jgi:hypothetical protein
MTSERPKGRPLRGRVMFFSYGAAGLAPLMAIPTDPDSQSFRVRPAMLKM